MKRLAVLFSACLLVASGVLAAAIAPDLPLPIGLRELPRLAVKGSPGSLGLLRVGEGRVLAAWLLRSVDGVRVQLALHGGEPDAWSLLETLPLPPACDPGPASECSALLLADGRAEFRWQRPLSAEGPVPVSRIRLAGALPTVELSMEEKGPPGLLFPDGTLLSVSRRRLPDGAVSAVQHRTGCDGAPSEPTPLAGDSWRDWAPGAGGLRLAMLAPRALLAMQTGFEGEPAILLFQSPDAGLRWQQPLRCDLGHPLGPPDLVIAPDAAALLCWRESGGEDASLPPGLYFRRYASNGATTLPTLLAVSRAAGPSSPPRLALVHGQGAVASRLLVAFADGESLRSLLVTLPSTRELEESDRSCECSEPPGAWVQVRATVVSVDPGRNRAVLRHEAIPGLSVVTERREVTLDRTVPAPVPGSDCLVRLQPGSTPWTLLTVRVLGQRVVPDASP